MGNAPRYKLSEVVAEARDEHPQIEVEMDDGSVFLIDPPELWPDAAIDSRTGPRETGIALMGAQRFAEFQAAGGSFVMLNLVMAAYAKDRGIDLGKFSAS